MVADLSGSRRGVRRAEPDLSPRSEARTGMSEMGEETWRERRHIPLDDLTDAMGVYSTDGQADDVTGEDAGAEAEFGNGPQVPEGVEEGVARPSPDGRIGPDTG
jgi:hypothetical protein